MKTLKKIIFGFLVVTLVLWGTVGVLARKSWPKIRSLVNDLRSSSSGLSDDSVVQRKILNEESVVIEVVEKYGPSVVTIGIKKTEKVYDPFENFYDPFGFFNIPRDTLPKEQKIEQDIGSGFVVSKDGLIVTNKHVVSDASAQYRVFTKENKLYEVEKIYRDPTIDLAILKINAPDEELKSIELGDSDQLRVGQFVIAIGAALGEFRNTVTTGVVSGLGRTITAGSPFEGTENLDNVIQTGAAINPGNSGGPLLNSLGQVIGVNVAVASGAQNIGFALPINLAKQMLENFNKTGQFSRPFLGIRYRDIDKKEAIAKGWVEGAGVIEVIENSPAEKAGVKPGDIITKIDSEKIGVDNTLTKVVSAKKVGQEIKLTVWREDKEETITVSLEEAK